MPNQNVQDRIDKLQTKGIVLLTTEEAAEKLRVSKRTMEKWRITGEGPVFTKIGRLTFYQEADIGDYVGAQRRRSTSDQGAAA